jgi:O-antigen ligase
MSLIINLIYFAIIIYIAFKYLRIAIVPSKLKIDGTKYDINYTGLEALLILIIVTGIAGLMPVLALHLAFAEIMCVIALKKAPRTPIYSLPIKLFLVFIAWTIVGLTYTPSAMFGVRMILKYLYPPLIALAASAVVDNLTVFLKTAYLCRWAALISFIAHYLPMQGFLFQDVFWNDAALVTHYIIWTIFSFALYSAGVEKKKNLLWGLFFITPCLLWAFRTDIFGTSVALAAFFFIKYRAKSLPLIGAMAVLAVCALFFIPSIKAKMYFRPDEVTIEDFITGNVREDNFNTSGRNEMWKKVTPFYEQHKLIGSGTGRVQKYFYTEIIGFGRNGQLHNDLLLIKCDNGLIGLGLFIASYIAILLHCVNIYHKSQDEDVRLCVLTAGSSLFGILVTLYSDNTVSYSLATLGIPWAFYGMALGLYRKEIEDE